MAAPKLTRKKLEMLLSAEFPEMFNSQSGYALERVWHGGCRLRRHFHPKSLRPGGTVSGPIIMALADVAMYVAVLSAIGWVPLAVTTNLSINFLRKPAPRDLLAEARLIKLGNRLAVGEVAIRSDGSEELVAHVTSTYSIPVIKYHYANRLKDCRNRLLRSLTGDAIPARSLRAAPRPAAAIPNGCADEDLFRKACRRGQEVGDDRRRRARGRPPRIAGGAAAAR